MTGRPDTLAGTPDVAQVEALVRRAIDEREPDLLTVVGFGEFSLALRWPVDGADIVAKRVPPFVSSADAARYCEVTRDYIEAIEAAGVDCVTTELVQLDREDGTAVVYHCQPLLAPETLVSNVLRTAEPDSAHPVVASVIAATVRCVAPRMAFDGQCSNWAWFDDRVWHLDFSTPLLVDEKGDLQFDLRGFTREYPIFLRAFGRRSLRSLVELYTTVDHVLHDQLSLLHREHLEHWCDAFVEAAQRDHDIVLSAARAAKMYRVDAKIYPWAHNLRKAQRFWMQHTGRRYDSLLSATSSYGN